MGEWERYGGRDGGYGDEERGNRANSWRSPQSRAFGTSLDVTVEKKFCEYLSSIKWGRLYHVQKYTHMYKNILQWDDSGALELFQAARSRFNAKESGEPCNNPLPDPDMYIDQIDHDCVIDQELIDDLEKELVSQETNNKACQQTATGKNGWDSVGCSDRHVLATGWESWGDSVDKEKEKDNVNNWDVYVENNKPEQCTGWGNSEWFDDPWERENNNNAAGWGNNNNMSSSSAWANEDSNNGGWNNLWNNNSWNDDSWYRRRNDPNSRYGRKRDVSVNNGGFKVRKVRYTGDRCQPGNNWRGPRGRNNRHYPYNAAFS